MTRSNKLLVASMGTMPFIAGMFFIVLAVLEDLLGMSGPALATATCAASAVIAVFAWTMVWRKKVRWTRALAGKTIASAALLLGVPIAGTFFGSGWANPWDTTFYLLPLLGWGLWMPATMWLWDIRVESVPEQEEGPVCLKCGYLLKGLTHTRCPECGAEPTLDELWAATCAAWG